MRFGFRQFIRLDDLKIVCIFEHKSRIKFMEWMPIHVEMNEIMEMEFCLLVE